MGVVIRTSTWVPVGKMIMTPNFEHPETPMFEFDIGPTGALTSRPAPRPDGRIIYCRPEDESRLRDALAVAQERPKWWTDWQRIERVLARALTEDQ